MTSLIDRLHDHEDGFVERKLEAAGSSEFKKTIVAFANSLPPTRKGVLFIGVTDKGQIQGVENSDRLQRTLRRLAETECYPPILLNLEALNHEEKVIVAAEVDYSARRPHFTGPAYVRRGSESVAATREVYEALLLSQNDKRRHLLDRRHMTWTVEYINKKPGGALPLNDSKAHSTVEANIEEVSAFFVRFRRIGSGTVSTEILQDVHISWDDQNHRPRALVWPTGR